MATALATISISHGTHHHQQKKPTVSAMLSSNALPATITNASAAAAVAATPTPATAVATAEKDSDKVRVVGIHEYKEAAACLADAFKDCLLYTSPSPRD